MEVVFPPLHKLVNKKFVPIFDNKDRYLLLYGGRNSSKSVSTSRKLIYRCLSEKYFRYVLIRKTYESIKDSQYQTLKDDIYDLGLETLFTFRTSPLEIECKNGNKFIARGLDKAEKLKSLKDPTGAWWEEATQASFEDFITVSTSMRSIKADYIQEILSFNPEADEADYTNHWIYKVFFDGHTDESFVGKVDVNIGSSTSPNVISFNYTVMHSTYNDNKYLTDQQRGDLEQLRDINPYYYQVYALGKWGNKDVTDKFWKNFDRLKHVRDDVEVNYGAAMHISFDENVKPYPALSIWQIEVMADESIDVQQVHEICLRSPNNKVRAVASEFVRWCKMIEWSGKVFIYGDASSAREDTKLEEGVNYFTILRDGIEKAFPVTIKKPNKNPPVALSAEFINAILAVSYKGINVSISSDCKESINDYMLAQENIDGTMKKPKNKDGVEVLGHLSDTFRYLMTEAFSGQFRQYQRGGDITQIGYEIGKRKKAGY